MKRNKNHPLLQTIRQMIQANRSDIEDLQRQYNVSIETNVLGQSGYRYTIKLLDGSDEYDFVDIYS